MMFSTSLSSWYNRLLGLGVPMTGVLLNCCRLLDEILGDVEVIGVLRRLFGDGVLSNALLPTEDLLPGKVLLVMDNLVDVPVFFVGERDSNSRELLAVILLGVGG